MSIFGIRAVTLITVFYTVFLAGCQVEGESNPPITLYEEIEPLDGAESSDPEFGQGDPLERVRPSERTALPDPEGVAAGSLEPLTLSPMEPVGVGNFVTSSGCAMCHSNHRNASAMRNSDHEEIAPFNLWQGSMMANSARDPLWHAAVSVEVAHNPTHAAQIEDKCIRCHAPIASELARSRGGQAAMEQLLDAGTGEAYGGLDGVACTVCHQIEKEGLGDEDSFSGGFTIGSERKIYGPHRNPAVGPMQHHVDYTPTYGRHVLKPEMCATCHTLFSNPMRPDGTQDEETEFPELTTYLEWKASGYAMTGTTCQDCHMPAIDEYGVTIETRIARAPPGFDFNINERQPFGQHIFTGGNTLIPDIIRRERATLYPQATDDAFEETIAQARRYLQEKTSNIEVTQAELIDQKLKLGVKVMNRAGHKFPTGIPLRRAWIRLTVLDSRGRTLFRSGGFNKRGRLLDQRGDLLDIEKSGGGWEPHRDVIRHHDEVQIYESVMADLSGQRTSVLLNAATYLKDNRLLPMGFNAASESYAVIKPYGVQDDADFIGGEDTVDYEIDVGASETVTVEAVLYFQPVSARFLMDMFQTDTPEVRAFKGMYDRADPTPEEVVSISVEVSR